MNFFHPSYLWFLSTKLHERGVPIIPRLIKAVNFIVYRAILPPEASLSEPVALEHYALGVVIHPNSTFGRGVKIYHHVTIAAETWIGSPHRVIIGDNVLLGAGSIVVARRDHGLTIENNVSVGAGTVVTRSLAEGSVFVASAGRCL